MNVEVFKEAQKAYEAGEYQRALEGFAQVMDDVDELPASDLSKFYHLIGNCYVKSGDSRAAAAAYTQALAGSPEKRKPSLYVNLGTALLGMDRDEEALAAFTRALDYPVYATPYKAQSGIGAAQLKLGNVTEAGAAYREAALDAANPAPGKALVNLGVCFMELGRTGDAIISYETALEFELDAASLAQTNANLGQAYMAQGRVGKAIAAFERATEGGVQLSAIAQHDYELAVTLNERIGSKVPGIFDTGFVPNLSMLKPDAAPDELSGPSGACEMSPSESGHLPVFGEPGFDPFAPQTQVLRPVEEEPATAATTDEELSAALDELGIGEGGAAAEQDLFAEPASVEDDIYTRKTEAFAPVSSAPQAQPEQPAGHEATGDLAAADTHMPSPDDTDFFDITEEEIANQAKQTRRERRHARGTGLKVAIAIVVLLIVVAGAAVAAYALGYGYPLQEDVAQDFFTAVQIDASTDEYWAQGVDSASRESQEAIVEGLSAYTVEAVSRGMSQTTVYVKGTLEEGGEMDYELVMSRDGVSWAIEYVELYFPSQG